MTLLTLFAAAGVLARVDWDLWHHGVHGDPAHEELGLRIAIGARPCRVVGMLLRGRIYCS